VSADYLNHLGLRELRRHRGELGLGADEAVARITGIVGADEQVEAAYRSTGDLAAAAYDTKTQRLYVVRDAAAVNRTLIEFLLSHELDHALEDQRFGLPEGTRLDDDGALARQALVEGLATNVMVEYAARYLNPLSLIAATGQIDTGTGHVPEAFVDQLTWTYLGGNRFVSSLRELAGGWKLVDYALDSRPPATTEQVLHPPKYSAARSRQRCGPKAPRCSAGAGGAPTAACSASSPRGSCSNWAPHRRPRGAPPRAGTGTAMSSGGAPQRQPDARRHAAATSRS